MLKERTGYFHTWATYGTWLPGDQRGWILHKNGWQEPDTIRETQARAPMTESACALDKRKRQTVNTQIEVTCGIRKWTLHAVNCRSNHIHVVVFAPNTKPQRIVRDLKSWATRRLKEIDSTRNHWWAERGSMRHLCDEEALAAAVEYVLERQ